MTKSAEEILPRNLRQAIESVVNFGEIRTIVEAGFGNGVLSNWMANRLSGRGRVLAFDANAAAVRKAKSEARIAGINNALFEPGDVRELPLPDEYADLTMCKHLLCISTNPKEAIKEMIRVTRRGGLLVAIEPATKQSFYDPSDKEFERLSESLNLAFVEGWKKRGADQRIGLRLPHLLFEAGLKEVTVEGVVDVHLVSDYRRNQEDVRDQLATEASRLDHGTTEMLIHGGISAASLQKFHELATKRLARYNNSAARRSGYLRVMPVDVVAVGKK